MVIEPSYPLQTNAPFGETTSKTEFTARLTELEQRIEAAARLSGRDARSITIVAVSKLHSPESVKAAYGSGLRDFGENYVQEALAKQDALSAALPEARWHLIGHLQSNKTNLTANRFSLIQTVDSVKLGQRIGHVAARAGLSQNALVQIKLGDDGSKSGAPLTEIAGICDQLASVEGLAILGLMAIAPLNAGGAHVRDPHHFFAQARAVFDNLPREQRHILSMGMSADFEAAIKEGASMVRIGTSLFGPRSAQ